MATKAALVEQVKGIQRASAEAKQAWWDHCDTKLGGVKDPNRHDAAVLSDFVYRYNGGQATGAPATNRTRPPAFPTTVKYGAYCSFPPPPTPPVWTYPAQPATTWAAAAGGGLADFVKTGQRRSQHWKAAWQTYCALYGTGFSDPTRYDDAFLVAFLDYAGQLASADLGAQGGVEKAPSYAAAGGGQKRPLIPLGSAGASPALQPPAKRPATGVWTASAGTSGAAGNAAADPEKAELVQKIKALQRTDPEAKSAWWTFCDEQLQGIKDPNRHEKETLQQFMAGYE